MYWDGEATPSVECPLGDLFGAAFGLPRPFVSERLVIAGGGVPVPLRDAVQRAGGGWRSRISRGRRCGYFFFQIGFYRERERTARLFDVPRPVAAGEPHREGAGRTGCSRRAGGGDSWGSSSTCRIARVVAPASPRGDDHPAGGSVSACWKAGRRSGSTARPSRRVVGTGGEDYFSGGFYSGAGGFTPPTHGATERSYLTGRASAYRFHADDPIPFEQSIEVTIDHGFRNTMEGDFCVGGLLVPGRASRGVSRAAGGPAPPRHAAAGEPGPITRSWRARGFLVLGIPRRARPRGAGAAPGVSRGRAGQGRGPAHESGGDA